MGHRARRVSSRGARRGRVRSRPSAGAENPGARADRPGDDRKFPWGGGTAGCPARPDARPAGDGGPLRETARAFQDPGPGPRTARFAGSLRPLRDGKAATKRASPSANPARPRPPPLPESCLRRRDAKDRLCRLRPCAAGRLAALHRPADRGRPDLRLHQRGRGVARSPGPWRLARQRSRHRAASGEHHLRRRGLRALSSPHRGGAAMPSGGPRRCRTRSCRAACRHAGAACRRDRRRPCRRRLPSRRALRLRADPLAGGPAGGSGLAERRQADHPSLPAPRQRLSRSRPSVRSGMGDRKRLERAVRGGSRRRLREPPHPRCPARRLRAPRQGCDPARHRFALAWRNSS